MEQRIFIFYANPYSFDDQNTGAHREGISINYLSANDLQDKVNENGSYGYAPCKSSVGMDKQKNLRSVPGWYDGQFILQAQRGKNVLTLADFVFVGDAQ